MVFGNSAFFARNGLLVNNGLIYANNGMVGINTPNGPSYTLHINATDAIFVPVGNTGQRPTSANGLFRYNSDTSSFEGYANGAWGSVGGGGGTVTFANTSQFVSNTANLALSATSYWGAGAYIGLTDLATIAVDMSTGINFSVTLGGNRVLGWPTSIKVGQEGKFNIQQDGTGTRTLSFFSNATVGYVFDANSAPTVNAIANKHTLLSYSVITSSTILITMPGFGAY